MLIICALVQPPTGPLSDSTCWYFQSNYLVAGVKTSTCRSVDDSICPASWDSSPGRGRGNVRWYYILWCPLQYHQPEATALTTP
ncbi:hypothetical protein SPRG_21170 [Saprolegnia parasitica CBS 223.65]|uniref:Uncharacterized protein n=1 Tax=Saprolegnia parasitica (strain CBS 223.65) TaxID=695850 RepID=A0A067C5K5_SAPPC|nr:hypothetical protein SPRG_21170 [Saprolegnia parasitica CBS 223.65]KDO21826.1 hypothetical protein SPRG_21170 [Saprolegnia parasitica CBS 223.65]|eukprot:XP_012207510.1 hypothetical protein SPRG_21170 [Saprolegnia parasitica CBS 223.65]